MLGKRWCPGRAASGCVHGRPPSTYRAPGRGVPVKEGIWKVRYLTFYLGPGLDAGLEAPLDSPRRGPRNIPRRHRCMYPGTPRAW